MDFNLATHLEPQPGASQQCLGKGRRSKGDSFEQGEGGMCWYPPGQTVRLCFLARLMTGSLWALMRKKCPGDRFSPSHRSKAKPPSRGPVESTALGICGDQRRCSSPLTRRGFGTGMGGVHPLRWQCPHHPGGVQGPGAPQSCPTLVHEEDEAVVYLGLSEPLDLSAGC